MDQNENDLQKLIEAARKSVQDGRDFRTSQLGTSLFIEKKAEEQKQEETESEWNEWGKQIGGRIDEEEKSEGKALRGILSLAAIIFAVIVLAAFYLNFGRQQRTLSQTPRINIKSITSQNNTVTSPSGTSGETSVGTGKIAVHNGVPSSQAPSWYKPAERGKVVRRKASQAPTEPAPTQSFTPAYTSGVTKPEDAGGNPSVAAGMEGKEYQPSWMKETPPPQTTPQGDPILIQ